MGLVARGRRARIAWMRVYIVLGSGGPREFPQGLFEVSLN